MTSTTSGTTNFTLDVDELIEQALEPVGGEWSGGDEQSRARRTLNLILIKLQNKRVPLHKIDDVSVTLNATDQEYTLPAAVSDVLEGTLKTTSEGTEKPLERWGLREWHDIPKKTQPGPPSLFVVERKADTVNVKFWPKPDQDSTWTAELQVIKRIEDITASYQKVDLPYRYYPLLVAWLSYDLSMTRQGVDELTKNRLKNELNEILTDTFDEDGERTDFYIRPGGISGK
jgi:hypothetical protein